MLTRREQGVLGRPQAGPETQRIAFAVGIAVAAGALPTLAILLVRDLRFVYEGAQLRSALDTAQCLIGALAAYLLYGRFRRTGLLNDLALAYALGLSAATNLFFAAVPAVVSDFEPGSFTTWAPLTARTVSAAVVAWAALAPDLPFTSGRPAGPTLAAALIGTVGIIASTFAAIGDRLPHGVERSLTVGASGRPHLESEPVLLVVQLVLMACFIAAAVGFARRARTDRSTLTLALAAACVLNAFARLNYFLYPSLYTDIVHTGDVLRLGYFFVLLVGAGGEINQYWLAQTQAAAAAERRRMARDLHDGLAQELAFIRSHTTSLLAGEGDPRVLEHVALAADRALSQSRRVVETLTLPTAVSLRGAVAEAIEGLSDAYGAAVELVVPELSVGPSTSGAAAWIAREAVTNALRHGRATRVAIAVQPAPGGVRVTVDDDGCGFAPDATRSGPDGRFGLRSMRERAELLGGELLVRSEPGRGTSIEAWLPISSG